MFSYQITSLLFFVLYCSFEDLIRINGSIPFNAFVVVKLLLNGFSCLYVVVKKL